MKTKKIAISILLVLAMVLGLLAVMPFTASAASTTPTSEDTPAEKIYVGGVELGLGQYVMNGTDTAVMGDPADDSDGYAYYKADGMLLLVNFRYEGNGYEYDSGMYAVIYSSGALSVELRGENVLKQTSEGKRGIFAVGNLDIDGVGSLSVSADWSIYSNGIITFEETLGKLDLTVTGTGRAIVSLYDSGSATDHDESIFVKGGDISATTYYGLDDLVITGGALTISSSYYALNMHPVINYDGEYTAVVSYNEDGSDSVAYDPAKLVTEIPNNYFSITPAPKTAIDSVSVSGIDLPEFGEAFNAEVDLDALTYGGEYKVADHWLEKYTGDEWVEYTGSDDLIEHGVRYRYVLSLMPNGGYSFSADISNENITLNGKEAKVYEISKHPFYNAVKIVYEFSYDAPSTYINSIEISDFVFPTAGQTGNDWEFSPESLTFGGNYGIDGLGLDKYTGTEWVTISDDSTVIQAGVKYRFTMEIVPQDGYRFPDSMTSDDVTFNGDKAILLSVNPTGSANIAVEFYCEASSSTTPITSISVSGADLPEVGETRDAMEFTPDTLTYGGEYKMVGRGFHKYTGTEWVEVSDTESLEYGVKYRVNLVLAPNEGYAFADSITSDDVTFNGEAGIFETLISGVGYASILYEFSYEAPATDYDITIAGKDDSGATISVLITEENCTDVLGDGTVSYDPTTNTLTLNNYVYNGEGSLVDEGGYMAIMADIPTEGLTIVLVGTNSITVSGSDSAGMVFFGEGNLTIKGNGSLSTNTIMYGITVQTDSGKLTIENAKLNITTTGAMAIGIQATDFVMTSGDLKITASMIGIGTSKEDGICINGGSVEIGAATGGYSFIYLDFEHMTFNPVKPDLSNYVGDYNMTAGANADGSDATDFNEGYLSSYKYIKITEIESYGIKIADTNESGETIGVIITEENYTDVLGDGTVSYDPTTKTLTLNGYIYSGAGFDEDVAGAIFIDLPEDGMTINLMGENKISVASTFGAGFATFGDGNVTIKGSGSLEMQVGMYGFMATGNTLTVDGGNITIKTSGTPSAGLAVNNFIMNGGNLKIDSVFIGIITMNSANELIINGGSLEIGVSNEGNTVAYATGEMVFEAKALDLSGYDGAYKMIAGVNEDGTGAVDYNVSDIATYKYIKLEPVHTHVAGTEIKSDANNHWNECACGEKLNVSAHIDENGDGKCDACDYQITPSTPDLDPTPDPDPTPDLEPDDTTPPADDKNDDNGGKKKLSGGAIAGIVIGSTAGVCVVSVGIFSLIWFVIKKKSFSDLLMVFRK